MKKSILSVNILNPLHSKQGFFRNTFLIGLFIAFAILNASGQDTIPKKIEAESFSAGNNISTEVCSEGTLDVGWINAGSWMEYYIYVPAAKWYSLDFRISSPNTTGQIAVKVGATTLTTVNVPNTGGSQNWATINTSVHLNAGAQILRLNAVVGGWNINWIKLSYGPVPAKPVNFKAVTVSYKQINLSWSASVNQLKYYINRKTGAGTYTIIDSVGPAAVSYSDFSCAAGTKYLYTVRAFNLYGDSTSVADSATTLAAPSAKPVVPTLFKATALSPNSIKLDWTDDAGDEQGFIIESKKSDSTAFKKDTVFANIKTFTFTGLKDTTKYVFKLYAFNGFGNSDILSDSVYTLIGKPKAPVNLAIIWKGTSQMLLKWNDINPMDPLFKNGYIIERKAGAGAFVVLDTVKNISITEFKDTVTSNKNYTYRVITYNFKGNSPYSNEVSGQIADSSKPGAASWDTWSGINGANITDLTGNADYPNNPTTTALITQLDPPANTGVNNYGQRIRGFLIPPYSGSYKFWIASDDASQFWLSTDTNTANKVNLCYVNVWTNHYEWNKEANQQSTFITLAANHKYYFEVLHKQGGGGDNVAVGWVKPGDTTLFTTGLESGQTQPTWNDSPDFTTGVTGPACSVKSNGGTTIHGGTASLRAAGTGSLGTSYCYFKVFNVNIPIQSGTYLDYWINPQDAAGMYVAVDFHCTDGTTLRDCGALDQNGFSIHPATGHGGGIPLNSWSETKCKIGQWLTGKTIDKIWVAYDHSNDASSFEAYLDDIKIYNTTITTPSEVIGGAYLHPFISKVNAPSNLTSVAAGDSITLSWKDNSIDESGFIIQRKKQTDVVFSSIDTTTYNITSFADKTALPAVTYNYRVLAFNTHGNSSFTNIVTAKIPDTKAPSRPLGLISKDTSFITITLSWHHSTDNVGVDKYRIFKNGVFLAATVDTFYVVTGLTHNTNYKFNVSAIDTSKNESPLSDTLKIATKLDNVLPSAPVLTLVKTDITTISIKWTKSTDNVGVAGYEVFANGISKGITATATDTSFIISGLIPLIAYQVKVSAKDVDGNVSAFSNILSLTTLKDSVPPSVPTGLVSSNISFHSFKITWNKSNDNYKMKGYDVYVNDSLVASITDTSVTSFTVNNLKVKTIYDVKVMARDISNNVSAASTVLKVTTQADVTAPTGPENLTASELTQTSMRLTWKHSIDNEFVAAYDIFNGAKLIGTATDTTYVITNLTGNTDYMFYVRARDASGNNSPISPVLAIKTLPNSLDDNQGEISLYPNPASENVFLSFSNTAGDLVIAIFNTAGQLTDSRQITANSRNLYEINISGLASGIYKMKVYDKNGKTISTVTFEKVN